MASSLRTQPMSPSFFESSRLTPSPHRKRSTFGDHPEVVRRSVGDGGRQSHFPTPAMLNTSWKRATDDNGLVFSAGQPLLTPSRQTQSRAPASPNASGAAQTTRIAAGTKRKTTPHATPLRSHSLNPLVLTSKQSSQHISFDRLAPLPPPTFGSRTPKTRTETDAYISSQTNTLTRLDLNNDDDSDCEIMRPPPKGALFPETTKPLRRRTSNRLFKDIQASEVAEAISPGGHVTKRRARSRPVSDELLESVRSSPSPVEHPSFRSGVAFPGRKTHHKRKSSDSSSSSSVSSTIPRARLSGINGHGPSKPSHLQHRAPLSRVDSATLFFGGPSVQTGPVRSRINTSLSNSPTTSPILVPSRPKAMNRHSFAGAGRDDFWGAMQSRTILPSPQSSPTSHPGDKDPGLEDTDDDDDMFNTLPRDSSFMLTIDTPSPSGAKGPITSKYRQGRDSGISMSDDDTSMDSSISGEQLVPQASTSFSSIYSDESLVTPGLVPVASSGWPQAMVHLPGDDEASEVDMDAFILRTLTTTAKAAPEVKKAPNTPVKKIKTSFLTGDRPWQSAVAHRVGRGIDWEVKAAKAPRQSMPLSFQPASARKNGKSAFDPSTDSEDEQDSPSLRKEKYIGLGLGRPKFPDSEDVIPGLTMPRWLTRRSSSGALSSESESVSTIGTPTRPYPRDGACLPPSIQAPRFSPARSASGSSTSSMASSPTHARIHPSPSKTRHFIGRKSVVARPSLIPSSHENVGRFDRDFVIVEEIGCGEFGKVIKVRSKSTEKMFAIKKSKPFEGVKHRHRLREEADVLQHLRQSNGGQPHPNVLAFVNSWEEDEALYIQTELCELGSLGHFLWEYGRAFPRLDEARVWKIIADLSNGLMFIHASGCIHLDIKPANIFITSSDGRFKIGDFGMASLWPRPALDAGIPPSPFEREGDKLYLAPEVLQGKYSKAADVFSFGMTTLETATNIVVPDQGDSWHRLRGEDFSQVDLDESPELLNLIQKMMRTDPHLRITMRGIYTHPVVSRARAKMEIMVHAARRDGTPLFAASPLAGVTDDFLEDILRRGAMDLSL